MSTAVDWDSALERLLAEEAGARPSFAVELTRLRVGMRWSKRDLAEAIRRAMKAKGIRQVPDVDSALRMVRRWEAGRNWPSELYRGVLADLYGVPELRLRTRPESA